MIVCIAAFFCLEDELIVNQLQIEVKKGMKVSCSCRSQLSLSLEREAKGLTKLESTICFIVKHSIHSSFRP